MTDSQTEKFFTSKILHLDPNLTENKHLPGLGAVIICLV